MAFAVFGCKALWSASLCMCWTVFTPWIVVVYVLDIVYALDCSRLYVLDSVYALDCSRLYVLDIVYFLDCSRLCVGQCLRSGL